MRAMLTSMKCYLIVVLISISLMASDAEHLFICIWALCMSSLEKCLFKSFGHFLIGFFVFLDLSHASSLYILEIKPLSKVSFTNMFSHTVGFNFHAVFFSHAEVFLFCWTPICLFFSLCPLLYGTYQWKYCCMGYLRFSCLYSPLELLWCRDLYLTLLIT